MEDDAQYRSDHDILIRVATTIEAQTTTLSEIKTAIKHIGVRCDEQETKIGENASEIKDLNTRWKIMVGLAVFTILAAVAVAGVVVAMR